MARMFTNPWDVHEPLGCFRTLGMFPNPWDVSDGQKTRAFVWLGGLPWTCPWLGGWTWTLDLALDTAPVPRFVARSQPCVAPMLCGSGWLWLGPWPGRGGGVLPHPFHRVIKKS